MKLDFVCVGTQRSGTTWLHRCLSDHDELVLPFKKELGIFLEPDVRSQSFEQIIKNEFPKPELAGALYGEINPTYYLHPETLARIQAHNPKIKIIFCVREPISKYQSELAYFTGRYGKKFFTKTEYKQLYDQYKHLRYATILSNLQARFGSEQVLVVVYEELKENPGRVLESIETFFGVNHQASESHTFTRTVNTSRRRTAIPSLDLFIVKVTRVMKASMVGRAVLQVLKLSGIGALVARARTYNLKAGSRRAVTTPTCTDREKAALRTTLSDEMNAFAHMVPAVKKYWSDDWDFTASNSQGV